MSWIREAEERLHWANVINVMSISPVTMKAVNEMNNAITFGSSALTRTQEEAIATAVSAHNECRMAHGEFLRHASDDPELASHIMHDYRNADLDPTTRAMLDFATKLTREPAAMQESDVITLREHGLSDEQILSVALSPAHSTS